jgi:hypothetical protein
MPKQSPAWIPFTLLLVSVAATASNDEAVGPAAPTAAVPVVEMPEFSIPPEWQSGALSYRLLTKDDFKAKTSNSLWGNFSHAAEVCTMIIPSEEPGRFHAKLRRECSFWNKVNVPVGRAVALASVLSGLPAVVPKKQPDWYILQHEQIHFAIMEVASRQLSRTLAKLAERDSGPSLVLRAYELTLEHVQKRHHEFDSETSGRFDPDGLERWVGVLERQLHGLCGDTTACPVRTALD